MSTPTWFAEHERQENMRQERIDNIRGEMERRDMEADRKRIENLASQLFVAVRGELATDNPSRQSVYVALNALAIVAGTILTGSGVAVGAVEFFMDSVADTMAAHSDEGEKP